MLEIIGSRIFDQSIKKSFNKSLSQESAYMAGKLSLFLRLKKMSKTMEGPKKKLVKVSRVRKNFSTMKLRFG